MHGLSAVSCRKNRDTASEHIVNLSNAQAFQMFSPRIPPILCFCLFFSIQLLVILIEDIDPSNVFRNMIMPCKPAFIIQLLLDFLKPFFCRVIHGTLVDILQKGMSRNCVEWNRVRKHIIHSPPKVCELSLYPFLDDGIRLLRRKPR